MTRQEQFKADLFDLLRRYDASMTIEDERINFYSQARWNSDYTEYTEGEIDLYFDWEDGKE